MTDKKDVIHGLREQTARQKKLTYVARSLETQRAELQKRVNDLGKLRESEQADVDKLEGGSLASFFYALTGRKEEKMAKEQQEAYAAAVKYDAAVRELEAVDFDLNRVISELDSLKGCEARLQAAVESRLNEVKTSGTPESALILELEDRAAQNSVGQKELREAIEAGKSALYTADSVLDSLDSAKGWGVWDLVGGGLLSDIAKHDRLDEAQYKVEQLQIDLRRFRTELADTAICADLNVRIDGFLRFADYFFDGLFADWAVLDRIKDSQEQVSHISWQIKDTLSQLERALKGLEDENRDIQRRLEKLALS